MDEFETRKMAPEGTSYLRLSQDDPDCPNEDGPELDQTFDYKDFYDLDKMADAISAE